MTTVFDVDVPVEPFVHTSVGSTIETVLPEVALESGLQIVRTGTDYSVSVQVSAANPRAAKVAAVARVEALLKVLAAWNDGFRVELSRVRATRAVDESAGAAAKRASDQEAVDLSETLFVEEHLGVVKTKADLAAEDAALGRLDGLPAFVHNCLDLNYLVVISDRPPIRWLLAAVGLEALTIGRLGPQSRLAGQLTTASRQALQSATESALLRAGIGSAEKRNRGVERLLDTTLEPVAAHAIRYLTSLAVENASLDDVKRWWRIRGQIAHGSAVTVDLSDLNRLLMCFQAALRRELGLEARSGTRNRPEDAPGP